MLGVVALRSRCARSTRPTPRSTSRRSAAGCARTGSRSARSSALWNLIALPTLNLPADDASLALAVKVFRTGLLDESDACDIAVPTVPLQQLHADAATAELVALGATVEMGAAVRAIERDGGRAHAARRRRSGSGGRRDPGRPARRRSRAPARRESSTQKRSRSSARARSSTSTSTTTARVLDEPFAAAVDSPVQWLFDRTASSGVARRAARRRLALAVRTTSSARSQEELRGSYVPALERLLPAARGRRRCSTSRSRGEPRATFRASPGHAGLPARRTHVAPRPLSRRRVDGHRLARHDGRRGPQRARGRARGTRGDADAQVEPGGGRMTTIAGAAVDAPRRMRSTARATRLLALQHPDGWWKGELETNVTIDAEDLFLRHYLGLLDDAPGRSDGASGSARSSATTGAGRPTTAARPTSRRPSRPTSRCGSPATRQTPAHMRRAAAVRRATPAGSRRRASSRACGCRCSGSGRGTRVPALPPEQMLLPPRAPLSIYSFGCWARQTIVALQIVTALRPVAPVAVRRSTSCGRASSRRARSSISGDGASSSSTARLHRYARRPVGRCGVTRCATAERWILERQEADGSWGGIQPPWVWSIVALHALGYSTRPPGARRVRSTGLDGFTIEDERGRRIEACQSPVWDTALARDRAARRGRRSRPRARSPRVRAGSPAREVRVRGDWAVRRPKLDARRLPVRVRERQLPRRRRHGR